MQVSFGSSPKHLIAVGIDHSPCELLALRKMARSAVCHCRFWGQRSSVVTVNFRHWQIQVQNRSLSQSLTHSALSGKLLNLSGAHLDLEVNLPKGVSLWLSAVSMKCPAQRWNSAKAHWEVTHLSLFLRAGSDTVLSPLKVPGLLQCHTLPSGWALSLSLKRWNKLGTGSPRSLKRMLPADSRDLPTSTDRCVGSPNSLLSSRVSWKLY